MERIENVKPCFETKKGKMPKKHQPILMDKENYDLAYVVEDADNMDPNSFLVLFTCFNGEKRFPKFVKFTKAGSYWEISEDRISDNTRILGLTWDYIRMNAMAEEFKDRRGEWWESFVDKTLTKPEFVEEKKKFDECIEAQEQYADKELKTWLEAEKTKREEAKLEPVSDEA